jgi:hypothetical protein
MSYNIVLKYESQRGPIERRFISPKILSNRPHTMPMLFDHKYVIINNISEITIFKNRVYRTLYKARERAEL